MTKTGVMIIGHGSRLMYNKAVMDLQADRLREKGFENVYIGFNESSIPSIEESLVEMSHDGIDEVIALPFFIASGLHMTRDIPGKLKIEPNSAGGDIEVEGRKMQVIFETPFGMDENLTDMLAEKIESLKDKNMRNGILVMGHGSKLQYNSEIVELNAKRLRERGYDDVYIGYNEFNDPKIRDTVNKMKKDGIRCIIALPLFIASGAHLSEDIPFSLGIPKFTSDFVIDYEGEPVLIKYATPLGSDPRLTDVIEKKIRKHMV